MKSEEQVAQEDVHRAVVAMEALRTAREALKTGDVKAALKKISRATGKVHKIHDDAQHRLFNARREAAAERRTG